MRLSVLHELDRAFDDSWPTSDQVPPPVALFALCRGHAGFQLVIGADGAVDVRARGPRLGVGPFLPEPKVYHVQFVPVEENTAFGDEPVPKGWIYAFTTRNPSPKALREVVRKAPFELAEVLVPARRNIREIGRPVVLFIDYAVPHDAKSGRYHGTVELRSGRESVVINVDIDVYSVTLPEKQTLSITNWFKLEPIVECHQVKMWSDGFWSLLKKYARLMADHRQTMFWIQPEAYGLELRNGQVRLDYARLEKYIRLFLNEGFSQIEGSHVSARHSIQDTVTFLYWASKIKDQDAWASLKTRAQNEAKAGVLGPVSTSREGHALLRQWLTPLWEFLGRHGWRDTFYQHVLDEPLAAQADHYRHLCLIVRQLIPGVKLMDAVHIESINGANDVAVPSWLGGPKRERSFADENRRLGVETWYYTCCGPRGTALNRFLDYPLIKTRLLHWYNYLTKTTGYLHWGLNMYRQGQNPWERTLPVDPIVSSDGRFLLPPGDTHIVWPGSDEVYGSLRLTAMRNGIEDYELLNLLRSDRKKQARADRVVDRVLQNNESYIRDPRVLDRCRRKLIEIAEK